MTWIPGLMNVVFMDAKSREIQQKIIRVTHFLHIAERHMSQLYRLVGSDAVENHLELLGKITDIYEEELSALITATRPLQSSSAPSPSSPPQ
jgi:hypothetical protein